MADTLEGIRGNERRDDHSYARKLAQRGQVGYSVVVSEPEAKLTADGRPENRGAGRRRTRLRSGKILDETNKFLCDCLIHDRSATGLRLALPRDIDLPAHFHVHDDETAAIDVVSAMWRRGAIVGVRYKSMASQASVKPSVRAALRSRYYGVPD